MIRIILEGALQANGHGVRCWNLWWFRMLQYLAVGYDLICCVLAEWGLWYAGSLWPFCNVSEKYYQINSYGCCLQFLMWLVGCRVFPGIIKTRHCSHAFCSWGAGCVPRGHLTYITSQKGVESWEESTVCSQNVDCKALPASICYRPELCNDRNSFSEQAYPSWDRSFFFFF